MKTIAGIRLDNLRLLIAEFGTQEKIAELASTSPVYLSQVLNGAIDSKTGSVRQIGDPVARKLEEGCGKPLGWMDNVQIPYTYQNPKKAAALSIMENMDDRQLEQAYTILHALAEPHPKAANGGQ